MTYLDWDRYFMRLTQTASEKSRDRSTKVGCVIVGPDNEIRSMGYNGFPRGIWDEAQERHERPEKYFWTEHAERNAIYNAARCGTALKGCRAYVAMYPCMDCARALVQAGIVEVVTMRPTDELRERWDEHFRRAEILFEEARVNVRFVEADR